MKEKKYIFLILVVSLIVRFAYVIFYLDNDRYYWPDTIHYLAAATNLVEDGTYGQTPEEPARPFSLEPVYPTFLAGVICIFGKSFLAIRLIQCTIFTFSGLIIFLILKRLTSSLFALIGMAFYLFYPFYIYTSGCLMTEAIYTAILVLFTFLCFQYLTTWEVRWYYLSALVLGIAFHTRVCSMSLIIPLLILPFIRYKRFNFSFVNKCIISVMVILLLSVPWGVRNYRVFGKIAIPRTWSSDGSITASVREFTNRKDGVEDLGIAKASLDNTYLLFSPFIRARETTNHSSYKSIFAAKSIFQRISFISVFPLLLSTVLLPVFKRNRFVILLYGLFAFYSLPYIILTARTRFRLPIDFVMIIFLTVLLGYLLESFLRRRGSKELSKLQTASMSKLNT